MTPRSESAASISSEASREIRDAVANGVRLFASVGATLIVAVAVRFWMPRLLGPEVFGTVHFAEQLAAACFALLTMGVSDYIRREVAVAPERSSAIFDVLIRMRVVAAPLVCAAMATALWAMDRSANVWLLAGAFAVGQLITITNNSLGAMLEAAGDVRELALINPAGKLVWGALIVGGLILVGDPLVVALAYLVGEAIKLPVIARACRRHVGLQLHVGRGDARPMLVACAPFLVASVCQALYARVDASMISAIANDTEVGWYGAAGNVCMALLLLMPILKAVVLPMGSRLAARSEEAMDAAMRVTTRTVLATMAPAGLFLALNADAVVRLAYGEAFAPAAASLRLLAPAVPLTYLCTLAGTHLIQLGRTWTLAKISVLGLLLGPPLGLLMIGPAHARWGDGAAGAAAAAASLVMEIVVLMTFVAALGRRCFDRSLGWFALRLIACSAIVFVGHELLASLGAWRLLSDPLVYLVAGLVAGVVPLRLALRASVMPPPEGRGS